jgi:Ca2+-binding EF-hand superfamily protein
MADSTSEDLFNEAEKIFDSGDRSYKTFEKLKELADAAGESFEAEMIGDLISAFYADGGETMPEVGNEWADATGEDFEDEMIDDFISSFDADGGETLPSLDDD